MADQETTPPEYVGFWRRSLAAALDNVTWLIAASWILGAFPKSVYDDHPAVIVAVSFGLATAWFNYFAICEWPSTEPSASASGRRASGTCSGSSTSS
jgi:hypothetical protein